jgi:flagellar biosynthesis GTPase FlhF
MGTAVKTSLWKRAFFNQYNYILLGSTALFSLATGSWLPAVVGMGAEVLWMVLGVDTKGFRRWVATQESKEEQLRLADERAEMLYKLEDRYTERYEALRGMTAEIRKLAEENQGLETSLIQDEMAKLDQMLDAFLRMATSHQRLARYLQENPISGVEREIASSQRLLRQEEDPRVQASLKQALSLAQKRLQKHEQIEGAWKALSVQIDTLEKSFDYLKSHILGIGTREELAAALDDLVAGVSSVSELDASVDDIHDELRAAAAARAATATKG